MKLPVAVFAGLALSAIAIYLVNGPVAYGQEEEGQVQGYGPWNIKGHKPDLVIWKLNSATGQLFLCAAEGCKEIKSE